MSSTQRLHAGQGSDTSEQGHSIAEDVHASSAPRQTLRRRARRACTQCRVQKRRCNGQNPCSNCVRYEYDCHYELNKKNRKGTSVHTVHTLITSTEDVAPARLQDDPQARATNANSGIVFYQELAKTAAVHPEGTATTSTGWKVWLQRENQLCGLVSIKQLISYDEVCRSAEVYFCKINTIFDFIDRANFYETIKLRWVDDVDTQSFDGVIAGIVVLGKCFEHQSPESTNLTEFLRYYLESTTISQTPALNVVAAWILRALHLRLAGHAYSCWLASCTLMHIVDVEGLHQDPIDSARSSHIKLTGRDIEYRRRLFWVARLINTWTSFDCGRSRVHIRSITCQKPTLSHTHAMRGLLSLNDIEDLMDPDIERDQIFLESLLTRASECRADHHNLTLIQCHLIFSIFRRLKSRCNSVLTPQIDLLLKTGERGLAAASSLAEVREPWWHVSNVPFQFICLLLAIDTQASLSHVSKAFEVLSRISDTFQTPEMVVTKERALALLQFFGRKKFEEANILNEIVQSQSSTLRTYAKNAANDAFDNIDLAQFVWDDNDMMNLFKF